LKTHTKEILVKESNLDELKHVNNIQYLYWVQDIAKEHWELLAPAPLQESYLWIVLDHHIEYKAPALLNEHLIIKTFVRESSGVTSVRVVEIYNASSQKLITKTETIWCLLNSKTKKPTRISKEIMQLFHN